MAKYTRFDPRNKKREKQKKTNLDRSYYSNEQYDKTNKDFVLLYNNSEKMYDAR
jgi:hypothetical protein